MKPRTQPRGVYAAVITPFDESLRPDAEKGIRYYRSLLDSGLDGVNLLGTTGEAMSIAARDRLRFMEAIAGSGLPMDRVMVGTGASSLADAIELTSAAMQLGFAAALLMPPFFYRGVSDDGVVQFFDVLVRAVRPPQNGIFLYNFPAMSGITFHAALVDRLMQAHPGIIGGVKDSSNDIALQRELIARHPQLAVHPGSEAHLTDARQRGAAGCISGSVALWPDLAARVWGGETVLDSELTARRDALAGVPLIPAVRRLVADATGNRSWQRSLPPLTPLEDPSWNPLAGARVYQA